MHFRPFSRHEGIGGTGQTRIASIREVLVRHQLAKPSSALSLNVPRAMRRKPKQVYVLRHGHLFGDKTDNGICAHLVEPLEGG